ncbi:MAG TPA: 7-cyano-7-deazaguanine synthase QueC [Waddliaceae bacterium]
MIKKLSKQAVVIHSGGMDSSICLAIAMREFGKDAVLSLSFRYGQRHINELKQAEKICRIWGVDHTILNIDCLQMITESALLDRETKISGSEHGPPNTLVVGRNGLMARIGAIHANSLGASCLYMGVIEVESSNSGYRDCSRAYMDLKQEILRLDLANPSFEIRTPLVKMTKKETLEIAHSMGVLNFLLLETISCYEGVPHQGCLVCPACHLRNEGIRQFVRANAQYLLLREFNLFD